MSQTHWKKLHNPDFLGAYSLDPGKDLIATIKTVRNEQVTGADGKKEECIVARFYEATIKPMILNSTNCKTIQKLYKTPFIEEWDGRKIQIFVDVVSAFGEKVEALRIRPSIPKSTVVITKCADCNADIKGYDKFTAEQIAQGSYNKFGKFLCTSCAQKLKETIQEPVNPFEPKPNNEEEF
jgi:hypothetical protein